MSVCQSVAGYKERRRKPKLYQRLAPTFRRHKWNGEECSRCLKERKPMVSKHKFPLNAESF